jgi:hypothetical protein
MPKKTARPPAPPAAPAPSAPPGTLLVADVARIWSEERRQQRSGAPDIKPGTVLAYLKESRGVAGRYTNKPMPEPDGYLAGNRRFVWWRAEREQALRDWWNDRPGQGHGTGGARAGSR